MLGKLQSRSPIHLGFPDDWEACTSQMCCGMHVVVSASASRSHVCANMFGLAVVRLH